MIEIPMPPYAPAFIESMRAAGYSVESAIADLVDNSISAEATSVSIHFRAYESQYIAVVDNGKGMSEQQLNEAMRHGSRHPNEVRLHTDLGRFGLGLKMASLSQCKKLTVVSAKDGRLSARTWDLNLVALRESWVMSAPDSVEEILELPHVAELMKLGNGTIVLWEVLDRLCAGETSLQKALGSKMDRVRDHIGLVFHRYLVGERGLLKLRIDINNNPVQPLDPFLSNHRATQPLYEDVFMVEGYPVEVQPYILPHISKLSAPELKLAGGEEGLRRNQGFYIYRNKRLILWGTWFRLARAEELTKLARVRVDIPNAIDHLWSLDIKKSSAYPPEIVRVNLSRTVERIADRSRQAYRYRGRATKQNGITHTWERVQAREGIAYCINRNHPVITMLRQTLDDEQRRMLKATLDLLETTFPADAMYADIASDQPRNSDKPTRTQLRDLLSQMLSSMGEIAGARKILIDQLHLIEPFSIDPELTRQLVKEFDNVD